MMSSPYGLGVTLSTSRTRLLTPMVLLAMKFLLETENSLSQSSPISCFGNGAVSPAMLFGRRCPHRPRRGKDGGGLLLFIRKHLCHALAILTRMLIHRLPMPFVEYRASGDG